MDNHFNIKQIFPDDFDEFSLYDIKDLEAGDFFISSTDNPSYIYELIDKNIDEIIVRAVYDKHGTRTINMKNKNVAKVYKEIINKI